MINISSPEKIVIVRRACIYGGPAVLSYLIHDPTSLTRITQQIRTWAEATAGATNGQR